MGTRISELERRAQERPTDSAADLLTLEARLAEAEATLLLLSSVNYRIQEERAASPTRGSAALRDQTFGVPTTDADEVSLANAQVIWYNTETAQEETYYTLASRTDLTAPGLHDAFTPGWYSVPGATWGGKSGPSTYVAPYRVQWTRGIDSGGTIDAHTHTTRVLIGMDGIYECHSYLRGASPTNYSGLGLDGDRAAFEARSNDPDMVGIWTHDHPGGTNDFAESHYLGQLYAGDLITAGPQTSGTDITLSAAASSGALYVRRIS